MQNLIDRGVTYTPGDRGAASTNQKQDLKDIKKRLFLQRAVFEICYDKDERGKLVNIGGNLLS